MSVTVLSCNLLTSASSSTKNGQNVKIYFSCTYIYIYIYKWYFREIFGVQCNVKILSQIHLKVKVTFLDVL